MKNKKMIFIIAAFAAFLATFNETFLNVAFTSIMKDLNVSVSTVQWLVTAYMLGAAVMVPVSAFAYKKISTKKLFLFTVSLLLIGSIVGALANNFETLLIGRIIQSLGSGLLIPTAMNIVLAIAPKNKLGTYMGIMGAMTTLGPSLSVIVAGTLLSLGTWHLLLIFFGILTIILFILALLYMENISKLSNPKLDVISVILISLTLIGILYGASTVFQGNKIIAILTLVIGLLLLITFAKRQEKIKEPLISLEPLKIKSFRIGLILNMVTLMTVFALNIIMPLFLQSEIKASAFSASLTLFPAILLSCFVSPIAGKIFDKQGIKNLLPIGFITMILFVTLLILFRSVNSLIVLALIYIPLICATALIIGPVQSYSLSKLKRETSAHGVTLMSTGFQVAGCIGSSVFTGIYSLVLVNGTNQQSFLMTLLVLTIILIISLILSLILRKDSKQTIINSSEISLKSLMKKDVYTIKDTDSIIKVMETISEKGISGLPVVNENNKLVGFISDGDIIEHLSKTNPLFVSVYSFMAENSDDNKLEIKLDELTNLKVKDICKKKVITVNVNDDLSDVCHLLNTKHLKKVPVMENNKMIGIINTSNITKYAMTVCINKLK